MGYLSKKRIDKKRIAILATLRHYPACSIGFRDNEQDQVDAVMVAVVNAGYIARACTWRFIDGDFTMWACFGKNAPSVWSEYCRSTRAVLTAPIEQDIKQKCMELLPTVKADLENTHGVQLQEFDPRGPLDPPYIYRMK